MLSHNALRHFDRHHKHIQRITKISQRQHDKERNNVTMQARTKRASDVSWTGNIINFLAPCTILIRQMMFLILPAPQTLKLVDAHRYANKKVNLTLQTLIIMALLDHYRELNEIAWLTKRGSRDKTITRYLLNAATLHFVK